MVVRSCRPEDGDDPLVLTAAHVCGSLSAAGPGEHNVLHFAAGPSQQLGHPLGSVLRSVPVQAQASVHADATVIRPLDGIALDPRVGRGMPPAGVRDLVSEDLDDYVRVFKQGRVTGLTEGLLDPILAEERAKSGRLYTNGWWVEAGEGPFAAVGDSGSIVTDEDGYVVGMVVAINKPDEGEAPLTYCQAILPILDELDVEPVLGGS
jgi:hypothetical protein